MSDAELEAHVRQFLTAVNEGPEELIAKHFADVEKPRLRDAEDLQRYLNDIKKLYGQGLLDMYLRIAAHGGAICELTDEAEISERVQKIMRLVALDGNDVPRILASFDNAAEQLNSVAIVQLFATIQGAAVSGLSRQAQRDALILDLTSYCLNRFPPATNC